MKTGAWRLTLFREVTNAWAGLMHDVTISHGVGGTWLAAELCLMNIDDCTKHAGNIYFTYFISHLIYFMLAMRTAWAQYCSDSWSLCAIQILLLTYLRRVLRQTRGPVVTEGPPNHRQMCCNRWWLLGVIKLLLIHDLLFLPISTIVWSELTCCNSLSHSRLACSRLSAHIQPSVNNPDTNGAANSVVVSIYNGHELS